MSVTNSDTTVGQVINEVGNKLAGVAADVDNWGSKAEEALEQTPGDAPVDVADPAVDAVDAPEGSAYTKPMPEPEAPDTGFEDPDKPRSYELATVNRLDLPSDPRYTVDFSDVFATYEPGSKPDLPTYTAPTVTVPDIDPAPEIEAPDEIQLTQTQAPHFGGLTPIDLTGISINPASLPAVQDKFDFAENPYSPEIIEEELVEVRRVLGGQQIIPSWIWDGIWSRGAGNLKRQEVAALREASREHASAGWMMPGPVLLSRESAARQKAAEAISELTRENTTKQAEMFQQDLWKAMEHGLAIESLLEKVNAAANERALKAAVETNNAGIAVFNAALQAYQITELQAKEFMIKLKDLEIRGDQLELQSFEMELKAAGFNLEYDKNQVELYKAQWSGQETRAKAYAAYADAIRSYVQSQGAAVDAFKTQVESNNVILQGWAIEWDAYLKRLKPAELRIQAYQARDGHFGRLVQEYQAKLQGETSRVESDIKIEGLQLQATQQRLEEYKALWLGIQTKLDALTKVYATDAQVYSAKSQAETSRVQSLNQRYGLDIEKAKLTLSARVSGLQTRLGYWDRWMQSWVQWNGATAGAYAQLGSAAYAAANYSLGATGSVGASNSWSDGYSESHNYSYDMTGA